MHLILCLDERNGMAFNHRRQTRDRIQRDHLLGLVKDSNLFISEYTAKLLLKDRELDNVIVSNDYLDIASDNDYVFCETDDVTSYMSRVDRVFIYRWKRLYPSDLYFDESLLEGYTLTHYESLSGSSHEIDFLTYEK